MSTLYEIPAWYWVIAIAFSSYSAYRGYMGNWVAMVRQNRTITHRKWKNWEMISVFCVHDALFHFICSMAGLSFCSSQTTYTHRFGQQRILIQASLYCWHS